jgi:hypothetical protein
METEGTNSTVMGHMKQSTLLPFHGEEKKRKKKKKKKERKIRDFRLKISAVCVFQLCKSKYQYRLLLL